MALSPEHRAKLLASTREAATHLVEDLQHFREVLARTDPSRGELRRLSAVLRRFLVEGDLSRVATPRIGKVLLRVLDNHPHYKVETEWPHLFFGSAGVEAFGMWIRAASINKGGVPPLPRDYDPERTASVRVDGFLSQRVLCLDSRWVSRREVIKYVANIASGVHSGSPSTEEERTIARLRRSATYKVGTAETPNDTMGLNFHLDGLSPPGNTFRYEADAIDPVLLELLAAVRLLIQSESVLELEQVILREIG
jgi:hypothetical protein